MGNRTSLLFDTSDGWVYNEAYDKANSNTVASSKASDTVDRLLHAPSGHVLNDSQNIAIEQDLRNINIINNLTNSDRSALYFGYKENITRPMYGKGSNSSIADDETYFNYLKGYVGSFLYSPYSWYSTDSDVGFGEFLALQAGNAVYQFGDAILGDDSFNDALTDWWEQAKGPYDALAGQLQVRDELKGKFLKVHLSDANIYVYVGIGLDGQFKVLADTDINTRYIESDAYEGAPSISSSTTIGTLSDTYIGNNVSAFMIGVDGMYYLGWTYTLDGSGNIVDLGTGPGPISGSANAPNPFVYNVQWGEQVNAIGGPNGTFGTIAAGSFSVTYTPPVSGYTGPTLSISYS